MLNTQNNERKNKDFENTDDFDDVNELIKQQYIHFNNLGQSFLSQIPKKYKYDVLNEFIDYSEKNYINIIYYNDMIISRTKFMKLSPLIYRFFCVDGYNTVIPNYLESINAINIQTFDNYYKTILNSEISNFKAGIIKIINNIINRLQTLKDIDISITSDKGFNNILKTYAFYLELINFGDTTNLLENYFRPVIIKNESDIQWRLL